MQNSTNNKDVSAKEGLTRMRWAKVAPGRKPSSYPPSGTNFSLTASSTTTNIFKEARERTEANIHKKMPTEDMLTTQSTTPFPACFAKTRPVFAVPQTLLPAGTLVVGTDGQLRVRTMEQTETFIQIQPVFGPLLNQSGNPGEHNEWNDSSVNVTPNVFTNGRLPPPFTAAMDKQPIPLSSTSSFQTVRSKSPPDLTLPTSQPVTRERGTTDSRRQHTGLNDSFPCTQLATELTTMPEQIVRDLYGDLLVENYLDSIDVQREDDKEEEKPEQPQHSEESQGKPEVSSYDKNSKQRSPKRRSELERLTMDCGSSGVKKISKTSKSSNNEERITNRRLSCLNVERRSGRTTSVVGKKKMTSKPTTIKVEDETGEDPALSPNKRRPRQRTQSLLRESRGNNQQEEKNIRVDRIPVDGKLLERAKDFEECRIPKAACAGCGLPFRRVGRMETMPQFCSPNCRRRLDFGRKALKRNHSTDDKTQDVASSNSTHLNQTSENKNSKKKVARPSPDNVAPIDSQSTITVPDSCSAVTSPSPSTGAFSSSAHQTDTLLSNPPSSTVPTSSVPSASDTVLVPSASHMLSTTPLLLNPSLIKTDPDDQSQHEAFPHGPNKALHLWTFDETIEWVFELTGSTTTRDSFIEMRMYGMDLQTISTTALRRYLQIAEEPLERIRRALGAITRKHVQDGLLEARLWNDGID